MLERLEGAVLAEYLMVFADRFLFFFKEDV